MLEQDTAGPRNGLEGGRRGNVGWEHAGDSGRSFYTKKIIYALAAQRICTEPPLLPGRSVFSTYCLALPALPTPVARVPNRKLVTVSLVVLPLCLLVAS